MLQLCLKLSSHVQIQWLRLSLYRDCLLQGTQLQLQVYLEKKIRVGTYFKIDKVNKIIILLSFTLLYNEYAFV